MQAVAMDAFHELTARWIWLALLHSVWVGLVVAAVAAVILQASGRLSHRARHAILLVAGVLVILGPLVATILQDSNVVRTPAMSPPQWVVTARSAREAPAGAVEAARSEPAPVRRFVPPRLQPAELTTAWLNSAESLAARARPFVLSAWLCGVAIFAGFLALGARTVNRLRREAGAASPTIHEKADAMASRLGLRAAPPVLVHPRVEEPFLCGLFRPAIFLPAGLVASCPSDSLEAIVAHELAHARRLDHGVNLAQRLVEVLLFFHPAVHWLSRSLRRQREFCADALAVSLTNDPLALAAALESVALLRHFAPSTPAFGSSLGGHSTSLLPRIQELLGMKPARPRLRFWPFAALPAAGLFALLTASAGTASDRPPSRPTVVDRPTVARTNEPMISYEVRWISSLDAEPWRERLKDRLKLVRQEPDVCSWIIDDNAILDLLTLAQGQTTCNVLQAPKAVGDQNATVTIANVAKQFYVAQVEKVENQGSMGLRPTVLSIDIGVKLELTGSFHERGTRVALNLQDADLLAMHTLHRSEQFGDKLVKAQYEVPTRILRACQVDCEIPEGSSLLISLGIHERRGRSSDAAESASELLQLVGLPPLPARAVACERLVCITPRRVMPGADKLASKKRSAPVKPESASQPSHARP